MKNLLLITAATLVLSSCASITNSKMQPVSVSAQYKDQSIEDASCSLVNDKGTWYVKTPGSVVIQKSYGDLAVTCKKKGMPTGIITVASANNGSVWGNILAGGLIGYAVDASSGAGFDYPSTMNIQMGKNINLKPPPSPESQNQKKHGDFDNLNGQ